jgi:CRISPR system Cascade subunit CasE
MLYYLCFGGYYYPETQILRRIKMLYMIALNIYKKSYAKWLKARNMSDQQSSLHFLLDSTFGPSALKPYRAYPTGGDTFQVLAYTTSDQETLKATSQLIACPDSLEVVDMGSMRTKVMPEFTEGQEIGFDLKTVPVRRVQKNIEMDAYDLDVRNGVYDRNAETAVEDRVESYMTWLEHRLQKAADVDRERTCIELKGKVPRQRSKICYRHEIQITGNLIVKDPTLMGECLASGVGRHKSYGYGMIILRAPQRAHRLGKVA